MAVFAVIGFGCGPSPRHGTSCDESNDCKAVGGSRCEPSGYCSAADDSCETGYRYLEQAATGLSGMCVDSGETGTTSPRGETTGGIGSDESPPPSPSCGDGIVDAEEECDDGNRSEHDGCTALCQIPRCDDEAWNGDETDIDCGGTTCLPCATCLACQQDTDCDTGQCGTGGSCSLERSVVIDWIEDCSLRGQHQQLDSLPPGSYTARAVASAATKWARINPPSTGWIYRIDCAGPWFQALRTPPGMAFATPTQAYDALEAYETRFLWEGGDLFCGLADINCDDNRGAIRFQIESNCATDND